MCLLVRFVFRLCMQFPACRFYVLYIASFILLTNYCSLLNFLFFQVFLNITSSFIFWLRNLLNSFRFFYIFCLIWIDLNLLLVMTFAPLHIFCLLFFPYSHTKLTHTPFSCRHSPHMILSESAYLIISIIPANLLFFLPDAHT